MVTDNGCYKCGEPGHFADQCPHERAWVKCAECERPGHPEVSDVGRVWYCLDCRDPGWRANLPTDDPRHREPGEPLYRQPAPPEERSAPPLVNEPGDVSKMTVEQLNQELHLLRQPQFDKEPPSPERDAALRELARRQVGEARARWSLDRGKQKR